jgi:hypothetical protein
MKASSKNDPGVRSEPTCDTEANVVHESKAYCQSSESAGCPGDSVPAAEFHCLTGR